MTDEHGALERLHTTTSGPRQDGRIWLNTYPVVDRIVRDFTLAVLQRLENRDRFQAWLEFECRRQNNLFLGITPSDRYETGPWNQAGQCGEYVLHALAINGETRLAVRDAFMVYVVKLLDLAAQPDGFDPTPLEAEIARLSNALLGRSEQP